jgi:hypothetical protein
MCRVRRPDLNKRQVRRMIRWPLRSRNADRSSAIAGECARIVWLRRIRSLEPLHPLIRGDNSYRPAFAVLHGAWKPPCVVGRGCEVADHSQRISLDRRRKLLNDHVQHPGYGVYL